MDASIGTPLLWAGFTLLIFLLLALDLGVFHRRVHVIHPREAFLWSVFWICLALVFNAGVWHWFGRQHALEFFTGYLIEKALSVDNIFVFIVIFTYFAVPQELHHRVLFWGILGALVLRGIFILAGAALIQKFHWVIYVFGAFLIFTGVKLFLDRGSEVHPEQNPVYRLFRRFVRSTAGYRGPRFFVTENGVRYATPLLLVLVCIEATDVVFALDSIPAIFAITRDPFIVYTSNIFAILGLRALYFLLAGIIPKFRFLRIGLAAVLVFVGIKMVIEGIVEIPILVSLSVIATLLTVSILASWWIPAPAAAAPPAPAPPGDEPR
ncbi:MAG: TerC family protein [Bryobacteraceae bacterium]|nr:TerC family protein [Bryobacteraceae bacterium]